MRDHTVAPLERHVAGATRAQRPALRSRAAAGDRHAIAVVRVATACVIPVIPSPLDDAERARLLQGINGSIRTVGIARRNRLPPFGLKVVAQPHIGTALTVQCTEASRETDDASGAIATVELVGKGSVLGCDLPTRHERETRAQIAASFLDELQGLAVVTARTTLTRTRTANPREHESERNPGAASDRRRDSLATTNRPRRTHRRSLVDRPAGRESSRRRPGAPRRTTPSPPRCATSARPSSSLRVCRP